LSPLDAALKAPLFHDAARQRGQGYLSLDLRAALSVAIWEITTQRLRRDGIVTNDFRIAKVQRTLRWFEEDIPLLNMRVKDLSKERQDSARRFAAAVIDQTRAELERLLQEQPQDVRDSTGMPSEPAD
jgi:hypothetical protein